MEFADTHFSRVDRYSLGIESSSGRRYVSIPVTNGVVDYEEYYEITPDQYEAFSSDRDAAIEFVQSCRQHEHDELLIEKPGNNRGTPV